MSTDELMDLFRKYKRTRRGEDLMGLYDYIRVEYALPGRPEWAGDFQTKDLDCCMDRFTITADGRFLRDDGGFTATSSPLRV